MGPSAKGVGGETEEVRLAFEESVQDGHEVGVTRFDGGQGQGRHQAHRAGWGRGATSPGPRPDSRPRATASGLRQPHPRRPPLHLGRWVLFRNTPEPGETRRSPRAPPPAGLRGKPAPESVGHPPCRKGSARAPGTSEPAFGPVGSSQPFCKAGTTDFASWPHCPSHRMARSRCEPGFSFKQPTASVKASSRSPRCHRAFAKSSL